MEHEELRPDIVVLGKGIGSGISVSSIGGTSDCIFMSEKR